MKVPPPPPPPTGIRKVKDGIDKCQRDFPLGVGIDWPNTPKEERLFNKLLQSQEKERSFHWYEFGMGVALSSLLWGILAILFGGK